jgi:hypothetical protein
MNYVSIKGGNMSNNVTISLDDVSEPRAKRSAYQHIVVPAREWDKLDQIAQKRSTRPSTLVRRIICRLYEAEFPAAAKDPQS